MTPVRKAVVGAAFVATALTAGVAGATAMNLNASAATSTPAPSTSAPANDPGGGNPPADFDPTKGGHVGSNGTKEALLTGDAATKARAAAAAAVPGGTVDRVENDAEGATYEAHVTKADGSRVTVKMDASFKVTGIEDGPGRP